MARQREQSGPGADAKPTRLSQVRVRARVAIAWVRAKPLPRGLMILLPLAAVIAGGAAWRLSRAGASAEAPTLEILLKEVADEDFQAAHAIAEDLRAAPNPTSRQEGLPLFVRGARLAAEAAARFDPEEQRALYRAAAGSFRQSDELGLPSELEEKAFLQAAVCLNLSGRYAASVQFLEEGVADGRTPNSIIHRLMAEGYARLPNPQWGKSLTHYDLALNDESLSSEDRLAMILERIDVLLAADRLEEAREALNPLIVAESPHASRIRLLQAKLLVRQAQQPAAPDVEREAADNAKAATLAEAIQLLEEVRQQSAIDRFERRQADYLQCVCLRELGDLSAALKQFSAMRRLHAGTPSGLSAGLGEAELLQHLGRDAEAVEAYQRLLAESPIPIYYSNPWMSLDGFRARLLAAYARWLGQQKHAEAIDLTRVFPAVFPADRAMILRAEAHADRAQRLADDVARLSPHEREAAQKQAWREHRLAGIAYARLALLRIGTREYPEDVWQSAQSYLRGRDFSHAARMFELYLEQDGAPHTPDAQTQLGEALMSLGDLDRALEMLQAVMSLHAEHPAVYRARVLAAQTHLELADAAAAKSLLRENLEHEALTPQSLEWRDSLFLLGEASFRQGKLFEAESRKAGVDGPGTEAIKAGMAKLQQAHDACREAAQVLEEALARYPNAPQALRARYYLGEAYREAAKHPRKRLATITLDATRNSVEREMQEELAKAVNAYSELIDRLTWREKSTEVNAAAAPLTAVERGMLRNAYFGRADALFDLGRYEEAIRAYTLAANRYQNEPSALEAFLQIAACHRRMRRPAEARGVLEQAKVILSRLDPGADFLGATRYGPGQWEELLDILLVN
ncbi:MAG: tetratricopeptide repeat protein [Planctomycetes bacterium]|nr:tetratricopeptide repeat protein [Planctomycetota bacterium]